MGRPYDKKARCIGSVSFDIGRYGKYKCTITFDTKVSECEAIEAAEEYLSEPVTRDYYAQIKDDLIDSREELNNGYTNRGALLGNMYIIYNTYLYNDDLTFIIVNNG